MKRSTIAIFLWLSASCFASASTDDGEQTHGKNNEHNQIPALKAIIANAKRIPDNEGWFEILRLPNRVYAFWEPGHVEEVNSFLIIGKDKDVLYDTGMGIGDIRQAVLNTRQLEGLPQKELMIINSHNHLDHNGGNSEFDKIWTINHPWAIARLTQGVPGGPDGGFIPYWDQFQDHKGVETPNDFDLQTFSIPAYPKEKISFLQAGDVVDLGDRRFTVLNLKSHSPDGLALYDAQNEIFFAGDSLYGSHYLSRSLDLLEEDLDSYSHLNVVWHYSSHGTQLIDVNQHGHHLTVVRKMSNGEGAHKETSFADIKLPIIELEGVKVTIAGDSLLY